MRKPGVVEPASGLQPRHHARHGGFHQNREDVVGARRHRQQVHVFAAPGAVQSAHDGPIGAISAQRREGSAAPLEKRRNGLLGVGGGVGDRKVQHVYAHIQTHVLQRHGRNAEGLSGDEYVCHPHGHRSRSDARHDIALGLMGHVAGPSRQAPHVAPRHGIDAQP